MTREQWIAHLTILGWEARQGAQGGVYRLGDESGYLFCTLFGTVGRRSIPIAGIPLSIADLPNLDKFIAYLEQNHEQPE